jgi:hypothetical protein
MSAIHHCGPWLHKLRRARSGSVPCLSYRRWARGHGPLQKSGSSFSPVETTKENLRYPTFRFRCALGVEAPEMMARTMLIGVAPPVVAAELTIARNRRPL